MKKIWNLFAVFFTLLMLTACSGNFEQVDLQEPITIPEGGIIEKAILDQAKEDNAIATFVGTSGNIEYEWTVFGSDIQETRDINLSIDVENTDAGLKIVFGETNDFGFPILLSVHLKEKWSADSATAYEGNRAVYSVSITGSKESILNISVNEVVESCEVLCDIETVVENTETEEKPSESSDGEPQKEEQKEEQPDTKDDYLSDVKDSDGRVYSDGTATEKDEYETDPVPEGKPMPVEPEEQEVDNRKTYTCTFSIECSTILNNLENLDPNKRELIPSDGVILAPTQVTFYEGESVYDVLQRVCKENGIHLESSFTPVYNSAYIEGIYNLYEFDCGQLSGWVYRVNGWYPNYGCSRYQLADGEKVEWRYTCDLGKDVGCDWME